MHRKLRGISITKTGWQSAMSLKTYRPIFLLETALSICCSTQSERFGGVDTRLFKSIILSFIIALIRDWSMYIVVRVLVRRFWPVIIMFMIRSLALGTVLILCLNKRKILPDLKRYSAFFLPPFERNVLFMTGSF